MLLTMHFFLSLLGLSCHFLSILFALQYVGFYNNLGGALYITLIFLVPLGPFNALLEHCSWCKVKESLKNCVKNQHYCTLVPLNVLLLKRMSNRS